MAEESLKNKAVKGFAWNSLKTFANLFANFFMGIILARLLMPEDYGAVAMITVFTSILNVFTDGGLTPALVRKENRTEEDIATVFYYNLIVCWTIYICLFISAPWIAAFYNMPILTNLTRVICLGLLITPFAGIQNMHLTVAIDFKTKGIISMACNLIMVIISIAMAYGGFGVWALVIPSLFSQAISTIILISIVRWKPKTGFSWSSFRELFAYSSRLLVSQLLDRAYGSITPLIVGKFFSPAQLGLYGRAQSWPSLPSQTFTRVLQGVTFPILSKMQDDIDRLRINYRRILKLSVFCIFPMMVGLAAVSKPLTIILITEKWLDSVLLMQLICFSMMWYPVHAINLNLLQVTGRSDYFLKLEIIKKLWGLAIMCIALPFGLVAFCAAGIVSSYVCLFINTWYTKKIINFGFREQMKDFLPFLGNCMVMFVICLSIQQPFESNGVKLAVSIPVSVVYYVSSSRFFHKEQYNELIEILTPKLPFLKKFFVVK